MEAATSRHFVIDSLIKQVLPARTLRFVLALSAVLVGVFLFSGAQALAAEGGEVLAVTGVSVSGVTEREATLEAQVNPGGHYTGYWFQIDTNSSYNFHQLACPFALPGYEQCQVVIEGKPLPPGLKSPNLNIFRLDRALIRSVVSWRPCNRVRSTTTG